jgi:hypothetical protein
MKHFMIDALMMIGIIGMMTLTAYPVKAMTGPLNQGVDPTAMLLLDQGIKQFNAGEVSAARSSFDLASQLDPKISLPALSIGPDAGKAAGSGFGEFGMASILGFIFILAMAAYEIGMSAPFMEAKKESLEQKGVLQVKLWPKAA